MTKYPQCFWSRCIHYSTWTGATGKTYEICAGFFGRKRFLDPGLAIKLAICPKYKKEGKIGEAV